MAERTRGSFTPLALIWVSTIFSRIALKSPFAPDSGTWKLSVQVAGGRKRITSIQISKPFRVTVFTLSQRGKSCQSLTILMIFSILKFYRGDFQMDRLV